MILRLFLLMLDLADTRGDADVLYRLDLARAIVIATDDVREQEVLTRLAWFESSFRRSVARCAVRGDRGRSLGVFQIQPSGEHPARDAVSACASLPEQAALALAYVRRSAAACPRNVGAMQLAMYVSGTCNRGVREARARWGAP